MDFLPSDRHAMVALFVALRSERGRRQRPPGESRSALPRFGARARARRRRGQAAPRPRRCTGPRPPAGRRPCSRCGRPNRSVRRCRPAAGAGAIRPPPRTSLRTIPLASPSRPRPSFAAFAPAARLLRRPRSRRDLSAPLGAARAQVHNAYIIAQTPDGARHRRPARGARADRLRDAEAPARGTGRRAAGAALAAGRRARPGRGGADRGARGGARRRSASSSRASAPARSSCARRRR